MPIESRRYMWYSVMSFRKQRSKTYYSTKVLQCTKTGLASPKFHSKGVEDEWNEIVDSTNHKK